MTFLCSFQSSTVFLTAITKHTKVIANTINPKCFSSFTTNKRLCICLSVCVWSMWLYFYIFFLLVFAPENIFMNIFHHRNSQNSKDIKNITNQKGTRIKTNYLQPPKKKHEKPKEMESFERCTKEQKTIAINKNCEYFSKNVVSIQSSHEKFTFFSLCEYAFS